jgi:hypothetical protein
VGRALPLPSPAWTPPCGTTVTWCTASGASVATAVGLMVPSPPVAEVAGVVGVVVGAGMLVVLGEAELEGITELVGPAAVADGLGVVGPAAVADGLGVRSWDWSRCWRRG